MLFVDEVLEDIKWRESMLINIKVLPVRYSMKAEDCDFLNKISVTGIYALWEGFVKETFIAYSRYITSLKLKRSEISTSILTHELNSICQFHMARSDLSKQIKLVELIDKVFQPIIPIKADINTKSNISYKVLDAILDAFSVSKGLRIDIEKKSNDLNRLLIFRNKSAHGDKAIKITTEDINRFCSLVLYLMNELCLCLYASAEKQEYKKNVL